MEIEAQVTCSGCLLFDTLSRWMVTGWSWVDLYSMLLLIGWLEVGSDFVIGGTLLAELGESKLDTLG